MILTNFNRSFSSLLFLIFLITTGCSQQSGSLSVDKQPETLRQVSALETLAKVAQDIKPLTPNKVSKVKKTKEASNDNSSIWERMFSLYALPKFDNSRIDAEVEKFLKHPKSLIKAQHRAEPYLHLILDEIEAKNLPGELALIPFIESGFHPNVSSPRSASGLWQFMPATGRSLGLEQNWWYDGRRDVYASTKAATRYLNQLNHRFDGDWLLALASYNAGLGNVRKAIKKNLKNELSSDYWSLDLSTETERYVPKILALAKIFANADKYNLPLEEIPNRPVVEVVTVKNEIDLTKAAQMAGIPLDEFFILNPAFNRVVTKPKETHKLLVKAEKAEAFKRKLAKLHPKKRVQWIKHKVKEGDDLKTIAKKYKTSVTSLLKVNGLKNQKIQVGNTLKIPPESVKEAKRRYRKEA